MSHPIFNVVGVDPASLLDGLTASQREAVTSDAAPLCILAGAGAGKTRALTRRIAYRVASGTADAGHVLALTFTRKAAGELSDRLGSLAMREPVAAGTFHAVAYAQLRRWWADRGEPPPTLLDRKGRLLARLVSERPGFTGVPVAALAGEIEWAQARLVTPSGYPLAGAAAGRQPPVPAEALAALYERYIAEKRRRRLADFDDLLARCATAIESDPGFGAAQRWRWRHVFVDEFQDVNPLQYRLLSAWLGPAVDLCVVGDPNQAIYGWNGADAGLLAGLAGRWPGTAIVRLDANHRCTPQVVGAAAAALGLPAGSVTSTRPDGTPVAVKRYATDAAEADGVAAELRRARTGGLAWSHLAVLMRTNAQAAAFEAACRSAGVPCRVAGATSIFDLSAIKAALVDIGRRPGSPVATAIADLGELAAEAQPAAAAEVEAAFGALIGMASDFHRLDPSASAGAFLAWLEATAGAEQGVGGEWGGRAERGARGDRAEPAERGGSDDRVTICTFHRAKGLEWPAVWVTGLEQGLVPIGRARSSAAEAEERRLLYVALTRAERELHCSWAQHRRFGSHLVPREPSPWLDAIGAATRGAACGPDLSDPATAVDWRQRFQAERERLAGGRPPGRRRTGRAMGASRGPAGSDAAVLDELAAWRAAAARAAAIPPHVLFHDVTLAALSAIRPSTIDELLTVPGLGPVKASRYGSTLLELVARHRASA